MLFKPLDKKGQLSLEYILSVMVVILIITLLSVPILSLSIDYTNDVMDSINAKNELSKITDAIDFCYNNGKGSKKTLLLDFNKDATVRFSSNGGSGRAVLSLKLSDGSYKDIIGSYDCDNLNENIHFSKGFNKLSVSWDEGTGSITLSRKS